ncbi:MAG: hypothetical protein LIP28_09200 [Deltaproteobacteria bacterium]|nr:hypothetical protein [Deltaproteobacteria bacterium]
MANALKEMSHDAFLEFVQTPEGKNVTLNTGAALGLCRGGAVPTKAPLAWLGLFWLSLISIPCIYFWSDPRFIALSIFLAWLGARRSKRAAVAATWREVKGKGRLNTEQQREVYELLVQKDWLYLPTPDENKFG